MKKLMIAAAIVCAAAFAQAANVNWSANGITLTGAGVGPTGWDVYLIDSAKLSQGELATLFTGDSLTELKSKISDAKVLSFEGALEVGSPATAGRWSKNGLELPSGETGYRDGQTVNFYSLILDNTGIQEEGHYFLTQALPGTVSDSTALPMTFSSQAGKSWTAYSVVPEPTSGLLLLLGVAGLALKRRRA